MRVTLQHAVRSFNLQLEKIKSEIRPVLEWHGAVRAGLFGPLVHGEMQYDSVISILVELRPEQCLLDLLSLNAELEAVLGWPVELVEYVRLHPALRMQLLHEEVRVL